MTTNYLPNPITLPSGVVAKLEVIPMPEPDATGRYRPRTDCSVNVGLFRDESLIENRPMGTVICGASEVVLSDGSKLNEDDIDALDDKGWDQLLDLGIVPTELVLKAPH